MADARGSLQRYLTALWHKKTSADNIRIYANKTFIFAGETLITVIQTPHRYRKAAQKIVERKRA